ncbi:MAG TPA: isoprenylcysteine carboxylmethyltransferase family protein [Ignavibacteriaceae bacterium]|nr:isoprenylcysteine carboxylmethyltransferase family protein [Ignavibacteriaceae bacterium]
MYTYKNKSVVMSNLASKFFNYRSYTPIPFVLLMLLFAYPNVWSIIIGFIIALKGELIRLWGVSWAGSETRTTGKVGGTYLIVSGPFAHLRNPLYLGNILIYTGLGIMSFALFPWLQIAGFIFFSFQYYLIVKEEEKYLEDTFGEEFIEYKKNVPRFIPRITKYRAGNIEQPVYALKKGLRSERRSLQAFSIVAVTILILWFLRRF